MQITLRSKTGGVLSGNLSQKSAKTLVIMCYGYKSTPDHPAIKIISDDLGEKSYATFVFRFTSEALAMDIHGQVQDIESIVEYFDKKFNTIVLLASSLGALSAAIAAARLHRINFLITVNGFFGLYALSRPLRKDFLLFRLLTLVKEKYRQIWHFHKYHFKPEFIKATTLVLHCPTDTEVFVEQSHYFYGRLAARKEFKKINLADHNLSEAKDAHKLATVIAGWLMRQTT